MASIPCALIVLLICLSQDHMGVQGETPTVFSSVGGDATLPCNKVVPPDCSSTEWIYTIPGAVVEVVIKGKINPNVTTHRAKRLSLLLNCSLHITDVTTEDVGIYDCNSELVYLSVLQVSASPSETEMEANSNVTLHCVLHTPENWLGVKEGFSLSWADETMKNLQKILNCKIKTSPPCSITRTKELRGSNSVHTQTCQLTAGGQVQTSVSHTIRVKGVIPSTFSASVLKSSRRMETVTTASSNSNSTSGPSGAA
ncbi:uncharacterized protein LOC122129983 [Clupea harengus]|uniref:Uncharacterized protein LOC122129983 n=1 Tax=Clupea harengus TaxID=7950 RepID=A0A8M1K9U5_CLUHA|nr:uncharacterized protein LOC122129983 [Clupea harengus]